jgi:uncharacterized membrane protein
MHKPRLDALADGNFAIDMTLLVIEIKVPEIHTPATNEQLWQELIGIFPLIMSYIVSFMVLASYWMAHNYIVTIFTKNLTRKMAYLNIPFFMSVALIPFSSQFLGTYSYTQLAIFIYGLNITVSGILLFLIFNYSIKAHDIENPEFDPKDIAFGYIRILLPPVSACIAVPLSFVNNFAALTIFLIVALFNFIPGGLTLIDRFLRQFRRKKPATK